MNANKDFIMEKIETDVQQVPQMINSTPEQDAEFDAIIKGYGITEHSSGTESCGQ